MSKVIIAKIQAMPDLPDLYICTIIENEIKQNQAKSIDKKTLVVSILSKNTPTSIITKTIPINCHNTICNICSIICPSSTCKIKASYSKYITNIITYFRN